jgi:hypothetical protein
MYMGSCSTYNLDGILTSIDLVLESSYVREEARCIIEALLAIMAPPSYVMSGGSCLKTMVHSKAPLGGAKEKKAVPTCPTTGTIGLKQKTPEVRRPSKHSVVTPSGNLVSHASSSLPSARPSTSYMVVGVHKPEGGYEKVLIRKSAKETVSKPTPSGKESESLGAPLRFKRMLKP